MLFAQTSKKDGLILGRRLFELMTTLRELLYVASGELWTFHYERVSRAQAASRNVIEILVLTRARFIF
jgi:hypothetical protein